VKLKLIFCFSFIYIVEFSCYSQSKKIILKAKIKSMTEYVTLFGNGKELTYAESYILYSKKGKVLESTNYDRTGNIRKKETFKYDGENNKIEEIIYCKKEAEENKKESIENKIKYSTNEDKTEEVEYGNDTNVTKKIIYAYNNQGEKSSEIYYDGQGNVKKKINYTYNLKHLMIKRESYREDNTLESVKSYKYEFY
jgi:hypothetical protein